MTSLAKAGRFSPLSWLVDLGLMCLIVGGFMVATVAVFWSFTQAPQRAGQAIQQAASGASPEMICECPLKPAPRSVN